MSAAAVVVMPGVSPTMTHGTLVRWLKQPGEAVAVGDLIAEIESDKSIVELESEHAGVMGEWLVAEGTEEVAVGAALVEILTAAGSAHTKGSAAGKPDSQAAPPIQASQAGTEQTAREDEPARTSNPDRENNVVPLQTRPAPPSAPASPSLPAHAEPPRPAAPTTAGASGGGRLAASIARQLGETADSVTVMNVLHAPRSAPPAGHTSPAQPSVAPRLEPARPDAGDIATQVGLPYTRQRASSMRRQIASRMTQAKRDVPHFYLSSDCDMDVLLNWRQQLNADGGEPRISVNDLLLECCAKALAAHPDINIAFAGQDIIHYERVDIGVAVATPAGLMTPVLRDADQLGVRDIAMRMRELGDRAQRGQLAPDEYSGAGLTLTNLGMYGVREAIAVINAPQACILALGAAETQPVVRNGAVVPGTRLRATLSVDHRAIDGANAARFLASFKAQVESPREA